MRNSAWHTVEFLFICANSYWYLDTSYISIVQNYTQLSSFWLGKLPPLHSLFKLYTSYRFHVHLFPDSSLFTIFPIPHCLLHHNQHSTCSKSDDQPLLEYFYWQGVIFPWNSSYDLWLALYIFKNYYVNINKNWHKDLVIRVSPFAITNFSVWP